MRVSGSTRPHRERFLILKEKDGTRYLPIWIGTFEADQIVFFLYQVPQARPLAHDFTVAAISHLGGKCLNAAITEVEGDTYHANVVIEQGDRQVEVDARPSDAVNVVLRAGAPIFVHESLLREWPTDDEPEAESA